MTIFRSSDPVVKPLGMGRQERPVLSERYTAGTIVTWDERLLEGRKESPHMFPAVNAGLGLALIKAQSSGRATGQTHRQIHELRQNLLRLLDHCRR